MTSPSVFDPIEYYAKNPQEVHKLSADFLTESTCIDLIKVNPNILKYLPQRYLTECVCLTAFLKYRFTNASITLSIPARVRCSEMWQSVIELGVCMIEDIPVDLITTSIIQAYAKNCLKNRSHMDLSLFNKEQRELIYQMLFEHLTIHNTHVLDHVSKKFPFNELVDFMVNVQSGKKRLIGLYQFQGIELTGSQANELGSNLKFIKLTNYTEKHRNIQYKDGNNEAEQPFDIHQLSSYGGIYFTTQCKEYMWLKYNNNAKYDDIGNMYWRRPLTLPPNARVCVESNHYIKCDVCVLGQREKI